MQPNSAPWIKTKAVYEEDDQTKPPDDDNLDSLLQGMVSKKTIPPLTTDSVVEQAVNNHSNTEVVLCRGSSLAWINLVAAKGSAGGEPDVKTSVATSEAAKQQVGKGARLPEFAAAGGNISWSWRRGLVIVSINSRYLTRGSRSENGWVALPTAPLAVLAAIDRTVGFEELALPNAS